MHPVLAAIPTTPNPLPPPSSLPSLRSSPPPSPSLSPLISPAIEWDSACGVSGLWAYVDEQAVIRKTLGMLIAPARQQEEEEEV